MENEFRRIINEIKPLTKLLPRNTEKRHHVTMWMKRLMSEKGERLSRNHYAKQLLLTLQSGVLCAPFNTDPPIRLSQIDELDSLLHSSSNHIYNMVDNTEPNILSSRPHSVRRSSQSAHYSKQSHRMGTNINPTSMREPLHSTPIQNHRRREDLQCLTIDLEDIVDCNTPRGSTSKQSTSRLPNYFTSSYESLEDIGLNVSKDRRIASTRTNNISLSSGSSDELSDVSSLLESDLIVLPGHLEFGKSKSRTANSLISSNLSVYSGRDHHSVEEVKTKHDYNAFLIKTIDKRSREIDDMKKDHLVQVKQLEKQCSTLQGKVHAMEHERNEDQHRLSEESHKSKNKQQHVLQTSYDSKLQTIINDFECQRFESEQRHSLELRQSIEGARQRIVQMKNEHSRQQNELSVSLSDTKDKLQQTTQSLETSNKSKRKLIKEKNSLASMVTTLQNKLKHNETKLQSLEENVTILTEQTKQQQSRDDISVQTLNRQMADQRNNMLSKIDTLQQQVEMLQTKLNEEGSKHKTKLEDLEKLHWTFMKEAEIDHQKKIDDLRSTLKDSNNRYQELEILCGNISQGKEKELNDLKSAHQDQVKAIEKYKNKIELKMNGMLTEIKMLEEELSEQHQLRKKNQEELFTELSKQRMRMNTEHSELVQSIKEHHSSEMKSKDQSIQDMTNQLKQHKTDHKLELKNKLQVIAQSKVTIASLNSQIQAMVKTHQDKLEEMLKTSKMDKQSFERSQAAIITNMKIELEEHRRLEIAAIIEKHKLQLQQIEHDTNMKVAIAHETIASLQSENRILKDDLQRSIESHQNDMEELLKQKELDIKNIVLKHETERKVMSETIEHSRSISQQLEARIANLQQTYEYELSRLKMEYETRISNSLLSSSKQESLQHQLQQMTQRAQSLQKQLDQTQTCIKLRKHVKSNSLKTETTKKQ